MAWKDKLSPKLPKLDSQPAVRGRERVLMHYHYRADPALGDGKCAVRWTPCACPPCVEQLSAPWEPL
eukprot:1876774-Ditylum_brightwellii.AAC.1